MSDLENDLSLDRLGSSRNDILLTKIIDPPCSEYAQKCTVWLYGRGTATYIIDSITITHKGGQLFSGHSGAVLPDADYRFSFQDGSHRTHALEPALVLSHEDRRPISFTLALAPLGRFGTTGGRVEVVLHYHTSDGDSGTLRLTEVPAMAKKLAQLLRRDIEVLEMIVTPKGIQRGRSVDESDGSRLIYNPLVIPSNWLRYDSSIPQPPPRIVLTPDRVILNNVIESENVLPSITERLRTLDPTVFDLMAGLPNQDIPALLFDLGADPTFTEAVLHCLTVRHYLWPNDDLAMFLLDSRIKDDHLTFPPLFFDEPTGPNSSVGRWRSDFFAGASKLAAEALVLNPFGPWERALIRLSGHEVELLSLLYLRRGDLQKEHCSTIESICRSELNARFPREIAVRFLLWLGVPFEEIWTQLLVGLELHRGEHNFYAQQWALDRIKKDLLD